MAIRKLLRRIRRDQRGVTMIEYSLIVALIAVAIVGALTSLGGGAGGMWTKIAGKVNNAG